MNSITFEQMPEALAMLLEKVERMETYLKSIQPENAGNKDEWFDVDALCAYHPDHPAKKTVYDWITLRKIPYHKDGKRLRFLRSEIDAWLKSGYHKTEEEMYEESVRFVNSKREGRRL